MGGVGIVTPFIGPGVRDLVNAGLARNIRCNLSQVPRLFEGRWRPHVAFAHTSPPDDSGRVTLGLNAGIDFAPVTQAMFKVAMVNARMPRWHIATHDDPATGRRIDSGCAMNLADFDLVVEIDEPLFEHRMAPTSPVHEEQTRAIARGIVDLLRRTAPAPAQRRCRTRSSWASARSRMRWRTNSSSMARRCGACGRNSSPTACSRCTAPA